MRSFFLILLFFATFYQQIYGQSLKLGFQTGVGGFFMHDLMEVNKTVSQELPFNTEIVSDFPPYWNYSPSLLIEFKNYTFGVIYSFQSTGSRVSARDYSGEYKFDMRVKSNSMGSYNEIYFQFHKKMRVSLYSKLCISFSKLGINEDLVAYNHVLSNDTYKYKSLNYSVEPGLNLLYYFFDQLSLGVNTGYLIGFGDQAFYRDKNKNDILYNTRTQKPVKPEWDGYRVGLSIYYSFGKNSNNE